MDNYLKKEDYEEPRCPLNMKTDVRPIPTGRVMERLDAYLDKNDYAAAERHLEYWLREARSGRDERGELTLLNEQIGLFRKVGKEPQGLRAINCALELSRGMGIENTVTLGTTLINAATAYKAFGRASDALPLYEQARDIYDAILDGDDILFAGLYNNMALTLCALGEYDRSRSLFESALAILTSKPDTQADMAITYLNLADLVEAEYGLEDGAEHIEKYIALAWEKIDAPGLSRDGYYAFVCDKCASVFGYYGYFAYEQELNERARKIYEGS